jgi:hypothetical protein
VSDLPFLKRQVDCSIDTCREWCGQRSRLYNFFHLIYQGVGIRPGARHDFGSNTLTLQAFVALIVHDGLGDCAFSSLYLDEAQLFSAFQSRVSAAMRVWTQSRGQCSESERQEGFPPERV